MNARPAYDRQVPHDRAVLRSPLGEPSAKAKAFLPEVDPYASATLRHTDEPAYIEPSEALRAWSSLMQARGGQA